MKKLLDVSVKLENWFSDFFIDFGVWLEETVFGHVEIMLEKSPAMAQLPSFFPNSK